MAKRCRLALDSLQYWRLSPIEFIFLFIVAALLLAGFLNGDLPIPYRAPIVRYVTMKLNVLNNRSIDEAVEDSSLEHYLGLVLLSIITAIGSLAFVAVSILMACKATVIFLYLFPKNERIAKQYKLRFPTAALAEDGDAGAAERTARKNQARAAKKEEKKENRKQRVNRHRVNRPLALAFETNL